MATAAASTERFSGFPEGGVEFFLELQAEQSRTWFKAHQADFDRLWRRPFEAFVYDLRARLLDVYPQLADVTPHFFRIQRDTRFSRDASPYKTHVAADLPIRPVGKGVDELHGVPGLYFSFGLEADYIGVGCWHMSPTLVQRYREAVASQESGPPLQAAIDELKARGYGIEAMERTKRVPPPYPQDHPRAELLKHKGLAVGVQVPEGLTQSPALLEWAEQQLRLTRPVVDWLDRYLG
jgi:uncharacterized protein (TIGR02453 family)